MNALRIVLATTSVILLIVLLGFLNLSENKSTFLKPLVTILITFFGFNFWYSSINASTIYGTVKAISLILLVIITAIYSYSGLVFSEEMEVLKFQFFYISKDKTMQVLLLTWGFSLGREIILRLMPLMVIIPFTIGTLTDFGLKSFPKNILLSFLTVGVSIAVQYVAVIYIGVGTPANLGSIASIILIVIWGIMTVKQDHLTAFATKKIRETINAWSVNGLFLFFVIVKSSLFEVFRTFLPLIRAAPITLTIEGIEKTIKNFRLTSAGVLIFLGTFLGGLLQGATINELFLVLCKTWRQLKKTYIIVISLMILSSIMDFSGMILFLGLALAAGSSAIYPLFAPAIGCLGHYLAGSATSSNILFGKLQINMTHQIGVELSWFAAANSIVALDGKMISPQSIAIAKSFACGQQGEEGTIVKKSLPYALFFLSLYAVYFK